MGSENPLEICARKRIEIEFREFNENPPTHVSCGPISDEDIFHWQGIIIGPVDTPIEGSLFHLSIKFSTDYPYNPPQVRFQTEVFHPNIEVNGRVNINILREQWSPALSIEKLLLSISSILLDPVEVDIDNLYWHETNCRRRGWRKRLLTRWSRIKLCPMIFRKRSDGFKPGRR